MTRFSSADYIKHGYSLLKKTYRQWISAYIQPGRL